MYVGVDIGGTKTLVAALDKGGKIVSKQKFKTPSSYDEFLASLKETSTSLGKYEYDGGGMAIPGLLDRKLGKLKLLGNLPWRNEPVQADAETLFGCPFVIENDANLAGLSEAMLHKEYRRVLYVTVSTGIGTAVIYDQRLDQTLLNSEGGQIILPYKGKLVTWESFASGKAIYHHFNKPASDIDKDDYEAWQYIARGLALGLHELIAVIQPEVVIIGGSIGTYFDNYKKFLIELLKRLELPIVPTPKIIAAERPEEAVVYGCYDLIVQELNHG